jgi:hypothetical protein
VSAILKLSFKDRAADGAFYSAVDLAFFKFSGWQALFLLNNFIGSWKGRRFGFSGSSACWSSQLLALTRFLSSGAVLRTFGFPTGASLSSPGIALTSPVSRFVLQ